MDRLKGKIALVTGAGSGIGYAITKRFIEEGAKVIAADMSKKIHELTNDFGANVLPVVANVSSETDVKSMIEAGIKQFGQIHVLVNNAGIGGPQGKVHEITAEQFEQVVKVNLIGPFLGIKNIVPHFIENGGGVIINTASIGAYMKWVAAAPYAASKSAVKKLTETAAFDYVEYNIRVNAIAPGSVNTPIYKDIPEHKKKLEAQMPMKRFGEPEEIANVALFLASDESSFVTGQTYIVDGGQLLT